mmetsp:Transcript_38985/g.92045  ORF Transcript_38985/g.92045 Transcript_38985/m.92045 type:complete len:205 (+) Transcript_38985:908-1522(+)
MGWRTRTTRQGAWSRGSCTCSARLACSRSRRCRTRTSSTGRPWTCRTLSTTSPSGPSSPSTHGRCCRHTSLPRWEPSMTRFSPATSTSRQRTSTLSRWCATRSPRPRAPRTPSSPTVTWRTRTTSRRQARSPPSASTTTSSPSSSTTPRSARRSTTSSRSCAPSWAESSLSPASSPLSWTRASRPSARSRSSESLVRERQSERE